MRSLEILGLITLGILSRLIPHPPNLTAMSAVALRARTRFGLAGLLIPLLSMALSDAIIGFYNWKLLLSVYASFVLIGILGTFVPTRASVVRLGIVSAIGSTLFFLITNSFVWAISSWYSPDVAGLIACLIAGLPFYYAMLVGDFCAVVALNRFPLSMTQTKPVIVTPGALPQFLHEALRRPMVSLPWVHRASDPRS